MTTKNSTLAFLLGAAAGGITALLLAPDSGAQTRKRLARGAERMYAKGGILANEKNDNARDRTESISQTVRGAVSEARHTYRDQIDKRLDANSDVAHTRVKGGSQS